MNAADGNGIRESPFSGFLNNNGSGCGARPGSCSGFFNVVRLARRPRGDDIRHIGRIGAFRQQVVCVIQRHKTFRVFRCLEDRASVLDADCADRLIFGNF